MARRDRGRRESFSRRKEKGCYWRFDQEKWRNVHLSFKENMFIWVSKTSVSFCIIILFFWKNKKEFKIISSSAAFFFFLNLFWKWKCVYKKLVWRSSEKMQVWKLNKMWSCGCSFVLFVWVSVCVDALNHLSLALFSGTLSMVEAIQCSWDKAR